MHQLKSYNTNAQLGVICQEQQRLRDVTTSPPALDYPQK
jgi:hypothetical protein